MTKRSEIEVTTGQLNMDLATAVLHAVTDLPLVHLQADVISTPSAPP